MSSPGHEWTPHECEGWSVCLRCGMVRNYDRETTTCSGALPKIWQRSEIEDCGQDGVCKLSPGCNRLAAERLAHAETRAERDRLRAALAELAERTEAVAYDEDYDRDDEADTQAAIERARALLGEVKP